MYHLACGGQVKHIPYKRISESQKDFIDPKYLPRKTTFRPPRNVGFEEMKLIFEHFLKRQRAHGPEDTFRFKSIKSKGDTVEAQYVSNNPDSDFDPSLIDNPTPNINPISGPGPDADIGTRPDADACPNAIINTDTNSSHQTPMGKPRPKPNPLKKPMTWSKTLTNGPGPAKE